MTSISDIVSDNLKAYGDSNEIYVISPSSNPVQKIEIYDIQGRKLFESASKASYYPLQGNIVNSQVIVKVITKNEIKTVMLKAVK
jgi:hypothetical protein